MRKGVSLSMTYVVLGLILLSTAITILLYFSGNIQSLEDVISGEREASQNQLARQSCLTEKKQLCDQGVENWASTATYGGADCSEYWPEGSVPECS